MNKKRAIIMGASSGIGLEVARQLLDEGWVLGLAARRTEAIERLSREHPGQVFSAVIDVMSDDAPSRFLSLIEKVGHICLYFHVSGVGKQNMQLEREIEELTVRTNALGFTRLVDTAFNYFADNGGGHIAAISSIAGVKGLGAAPSYSATKAFQSIYLQALEQQAHMRRLHISFTDIRPGFVSTPLLGDEHKYPLLMQTEKVASDIVRSIHKKRRVRIIDWRYRLIVFFWKLLPNRLWAYLPVTNK